MKCSEYSSADLKHTVAFQRLTRTADGAGGATMAWATIAGAPVRAGVKPLSGNERWRSDRIEADVRFRIVVRYWAGLLPSDRIVMRSLNHNIRFIQNVEFANKWLVIDADGGVPL